jgi:DNA uptake protein ComE-like DNA-binding protein
MKVPSRYRRRPAVVLIVVLVVVVVLSLAAYSFTDLMQAHRRAAILSGKQLQARMLVDSGVDAVKLYLTLDETTRGSEGGHYDNPLYFQAAQVIPELDAPSRGSFTVLAPLLDDETFQAGVRYGLEDESARLNLNLLLVAEKVQAGAARTFLMALPGMTEDVADAILDWIDPDDEPREYGAELEYYSAMNPPYGPRNAPPATIEELLLVRGVTPQLLFGIDSNRNGVADAHEMSNANLGVGTIPGSTATTTTTTDSAGFSRGWAAYLTLYSSERNARADGTPRIWLNNTDLNQLQQELSEVFSDEWTNFILAYRLYGAASGNGQGEVQSAADVELDLNQQPRGTFSQVLDLIGKRVQIQQENGDMIILQSPFDSAPLAMGVYLPQLMENCTAGQSAVIPGRININQAPLELLLGIPGMNEDIANEIVSRRTPDAEEDNPNRQYETWLLAEAIVTLDEMRILTPFITAGGDVYRAQIVGYFQGGGPSSRVEVVFDATSSSPRLLFWRDLSHLGRGYSLETLGIDLIEPVQ